MNSFRVTYEIVTPESAEQGDAAERGYVAPGGWHQTEPEELTLRQAVDLVSCVEDAGSCFVEADPTRDYRDGSEETRSLHPPRNISAASYERLRKLLKVR